MTVVITPCGNLQRITDVQAPHHQPLGRAYHEGANAYLIGAPITCNIYSGVEPMIADRTLRGEWERGYKVARKHDRFDATVAKRKAAKG
jgi:hypothetical protein